MGRQKFIIERGAVDQYIEKGLSPRSQLRKDRGKVETRVSAIVQDMSPVLGTGGKLLYPVRNGSIKGYFVAIGYADRIKVSAYERHNDASKIGLLPES